MARCQPLADEFQVKYVPCPPEHRAVWNHGMGVLLKLIEQLEAQQAGVVVIAESCQQDTPVGGTHANQA